MFVGCIVCVDCGVVVMMFRERREESCCAVTFGWVVERVGREVRRLWIGSDIFCGAPGGIGYAEGGGEEGEGEGSGDAADRSMAQQIQ